MEQYQKSTGTAATLRYAEKQLSSRVKRGIWVFAGAGNSAVAGKNRDPSRCSG